MEKIVDAIELDTLWYGAKACKAETVEEIRGVFKISHRHLLYANKEAAMYYEEEDKS